MNVILYFATLEKAHTHAQAFKTAGIETSCNEDKAMPHLSFTMPQETVFFSRCDSIEITKQIGHESLIMIPSEDLDFHKLMTFY